MAGDGVGEDVEAEHLDGTAPRRPMVLYVLPIGIRIASVVCNTRRSVRPVEGVGRGPSNSSFKFRQYSGSHGLSTR